MKLFYQLSSKQQDAAIEHCADLVANNAIEHGLKIEATDDTDGKALKDRIDAILKSLKMNVELKTREDKLQFLMDDEVFSDTIFELASEMANNAFYHDNDELVVFTDALDSRVASNDDEDEAADDEADEDIKTVEDLVRPHLKKLLN